MIVFTQGRSSINIATRTTVVIQACNVIVTLVSTCYEVLADTQTGSLIDRLFR